ncbi:MULTISPECIES: acyl-CoA thioesterase [Acinetobacter]|jgi:acyl-CoA thioester hydrolase|uniref:acyl-CoA thioesterase n=1 Tax=Acinetobacter TaxID=469 RepID=UPI0004D50A8E|nr:MULTISPECIES: acyl-CoA thioesterase [Acinetobacter]KEC82783.1 thioesterase [Acinetobacter sp. ETR1]KQW89577.1 thioesterase [Acinetobacter sp. Root1280]MBP2546454.1 acyl-CoA thioester hydrolase [Acinetobacter guillouiae]MCG7222758.1 acyl-CoA thioesterase [Acinetobacter sp. AG3]MCT9980312.1 acyl-CoA thioesterase [Acinetobacter sp. I-MWF]
MNPLTQFPIVYEQKVAWGDMDAFGHVNNVMYYRYIESARIEYFDRLNVFDQDVLTVVASSQCKYLKPVFYPDVLHIGARVEEMRNSAIRMHYVLFSQQQQQIVADGEAVIVFVDKVAMKKALIPQQLRKIIIDLEATVHNDLKNT